MDREEKFWYDYIIDARENGNRFLPISKNISQDLVQKIKTFQILPIQIAQSRILQDLLHLIF